MDRWTIEAADQRVVARIDGDLDLGNGRDLVDFLVRLSAVSECPVEVDLSGRRLHRLERTPGAPHRASSSCLNGTARSASSIRVPAPGGFWSSRDARSSSESFTARRRSPTRRGSEPRRRGDEAGGSRPQSVDETATREVVGPARAPSVPRSLAARRIRPDGEVRS